MSTRIQFLTFSISLVACALVASPARAQQVLPGVQVGGAAGVSIPTGRLGDAYDAGFNLSGLVQLRTPEEAVGVRGEVLWEQFSHKQSVPDAGTKDAVSLVLNAMYFVPGYALRPYFIGGMGFYHVSDQGNHPGFNFGVGIDIPMTGLAAHFEARLHRVLTDGAHYTTVPFSFGVRF